MKTPVFLLKLQAFRIPALLKRGSNTGVFMWILKIFSNMYFEEHLQTATSEVILNQKWKIRKQVFYKKRFSNIY